MDEIKFKNNFTLGVDTSSLHLETTDENNSWYDWYKNKFLKDTTQMTNYYYDFKKTIDTMSNMGVETYYFTIEWSLIEPKPNEFSIESVNKYREQLKYIIKKGIKPLVTLHHFRNPVWFEKMGAFTNQDCSRLFLRFVDYTIKNIGDLADEYITISDAKTYAMYSYYLGKYPPFLKDFKQMKEVYSNLALCHIRAYKRIHSIRKRKGYVNTKVSFSNKINIFVPKNKFSIVDKMGVRFFETNLQTSLIHAMSTGKFTYPLKKPKSIKIGKYYDFIAINFSNVNVVSGFKNKVIETNINKYTFSNYARIIKTICEKMYKKYNAPIYITGSGLYNEDDNFISQFIYSTLKGLMDSDCSIARYYYGPFIDKLQCLDGESTEFGLVKTDEEAYKIKQSGYFYSEIIKNKAITKQMIDKYL